jgi:hypothetical protein
MSTPMVFKECFDILCHRLIGEGSSRRVFSSKVMPECVIKIEEDCGKFQNVMEWETWQRVRGTPYSHWFAECKWISPNGLVLVMQRTEPAMEKEYPVKMPAFLSDFKRPNYGIITNYTLAKLNKPKIRTFVCHDYGTNLLMEHGMTSKKMTTADWSEE